MDQFDNCSVCGKRIGYFRKLEAREMDKDPLHLIPLSQFCSDECAKKGLKMVLKDIEKEEDLSK